MIRFIIFNNYFKTRLKIFYISLTVIFSIQTKLNSFVEKN